MRWTLRCRGPAGPVTIGVEDTCTVHELQQIIADKTEITVERQELLAGFPPKALQLTGAQTSSISGVGIANGDSLVVREREDVPEAVQEPEPAQSLANGNTAETDHDADLARALAASLADSVPAAHTFAGVSTSRQPIAAPAAAALGAGPAPTSFRLADGSSVVRRIIDSDNSCLFNAVGYVMERSRRKAQELRQVIARVVAADPDTYTEGFLEKPNREYCSWILKKDTWGGAIELAILAAYYGRQIAAYDIRTKRCDVYGQDSHHQERVMVIYDGLHYDALAVSLFEGSPEELDVTVLDVRSADCEAIQQGAAKLVEACHNARQFTDVANFTLRCGVCQMGLKGEKEAVMHANATGHQNFQEY